MLDEVLPDVFVEQSLTKAFLEVVCKLDGVLPDSFGQVNWMRVFLVIVQMKVLVGVGCMIVLGYHHCSQMGLSSLVHAEVPLILLVQVPGTSAALVLLC